MTSRWLMLGLAALLVASTALSEIYEWRDAGGARHFTNQKDLLPAAHQASARLVVRSRPDAACAPGAEPQPAPSGSGAEGAQVVSTERGFTEAYQSGVRDALAATARENYAQGGSVNIVGPLAIAHTDVASPLPTFAPYPAFVTTSFDRGRSRHLTLRMLLQDQFQLDRDGPFVYQRIPQVGLGPNLDPFLPRGLPHRFVRSRVLYR